MTLIDRKMDSWSEKLTFVIPVFNGEKSISKTIESILSAVACRIIVIDDGSTDNTVMIAKKHFVECYSIKNTGAYNARAFGASLVSTEFTMLLDSDDFLNEDFVLALEFLDEHKSALAVIGAYLSIGRHYKRRNYQKVSKLDLNSLIIRQSGYAPISASIWRTTGLVDALNHSVRPLALQRSDDYELFIRTLMIGDVLTCTHMIIDYSVVGGKSTQNFEASVQSSVEIAMYYAKNIGLEILPLTNRIQIALATYRRLQVILYSKGRFQVYLQFLKSLSDLYYFSVARKYIRNNQR